MEARSELKTESLRGFFNIESRATVAMLEAISIDKAFVIVDEAISEPLVEIVLHNSDGALSTYALSKKEIVNALTLLPHIDMEAFGNEITTKQDEIQHIALDKVKSVEQALRALYHALNSEPLVHGHQIHLWSLFPYYRNSDVYPAPAELEKSPCIPVYFPL